MDNKTKRTSSIDSSSGGEEKEKVTNAEYHAAKRKLMKYEETNYNTIALIPCSGDKGWCEMSEHSALIYYYKVCYPLGIKVNFDADINDFYTKYKYGKIKTRGFDAVRKRLEKVGLLEHELVRDGKAVFALKVAYSKEEIDAMWSEEEARRDKIGRILKANFADPTIHQMMMHIATRLHAVCLKRLDKLSSATLGKRMVEEIDGMLRKYYEMAVLETNDRKADWYELVTGCRALAIDLQVVSELGLWSRANCVEIGEKIFELLERLKKRYEACKS